ncbi:hypothetical protein [Flammeovirga aprica]|uniref:Transporter n=1 Tax=Flammeovirga aprica JL-4 TaxID=694437 RepID=A0A7X9XDE2_9BACT|nr:hypothetical protein [Flammeovirga aprica]NME72806.1 hypothetical protein [Flammeovirga aprica JL-4]
MKILKLKSIKILAIFAMSVLGINSANAQTADEIANKLQNPLSSIIALPIQHNMGMGIPGMDGTTYTMSLQPIVAQEFEKFSLVHRGVMGLSYLPATTGMENNLNPQFGITDLNYSFFFAPKNVGKLAWGIGPSIDMPTATSEMLGTGKWSAGASLALVYQTNGWTFDMIFRQTVSFAGDQNRNDVNTFVGQTLIAKSLGKGWMINTFPTIVANWNAEKGQQWTVPVGGGISKLVFMGKLPVNLGVQYYNNVVKPDHVGQHELRLMTTFVFKK